MANATEDNLPSSPKALRRDNGILLCWMTANHVTDDLCNQNGTLGTRYAVHTGRIFVLKIQNEQCSAKEDNAAILWATLWA